MKKNKFKLTFILGTLSTTLFTFCSKTPEVDKITQLSKVVINCEDTVSHPTKKEGGAHGGNFYTRTDSSNVYGIGTIFKIHDSLKTKDLRIKFDGWVRLGDLATDKKFAMSLEEDGGAGLKWLDLDFRKYIKETNQWIHVVDSVDFVSPDFSKPNMIVKLFPFNPSGKSTLDCDDVELTFYQVEKPKKD